MRSEWNTWRHSRPMLALFAIGLSQVLNFCTSSPTGPSADESKVIGNWAGSLVIAPDTFTVSMQNKADKSYSTSTAVNGLALDQESGTWRAAGGQYITAPATCEGAAVPGGALVLIACTGPDTLSINISGDTWNINFLSSGTVYTLPMRKL